MTAACFVVACATIDPPGWDRRDQMASSTLNAKPWVMYTIAPHVWVSPLGEIEIEHERGLITFGPHTDGFTFNVRFHRSGQAAIACQVYVDSHGALARFPQTHGALLGCAARDGRIVLSMGKGCRYPNDLFTPICHRGTLRLGGEPELRVHQGYLKSAGMPLGRLSITSGSGQLLGAADVVLESGIRLWTRPVTSEAEQQRERWLALVVAAIHHFHHVAQRNP